MNSILKYFLITIILLFFVVSVQGETGDKTVYRCAACGKEITKTAAIVDGKLYHPECFRCALCGKPIEGEYLKGTDGKYYHPECLEKLQQPICAYCGKPITEGKYITYEGSAYHPECYTNHIAPRCDICGKPLEGSYITDYWGNHFHPYHIKEFPVCAVCGRLVWQKDKVWLDENRCLCPICSEQSVVDPEHARRLLEEVRDELASMGIVVKTLGIRIELVENPVLAMGRKTDKHSHTFAHIYWKEGYAVEDDQTATIRTLRGVPEDFMRGIIAHELMHAWQHENGVDRTSLKLREGSANWVSSLIYNRMHTKRGQFFITGLENSEDPIYGEGYREMRKYADKHGVQETLKMLITEGEKNTDE